MLPREFRNALGQVNSRVKAPEGPLAQLETRTCSLPDSITVIELKIYDLEKEIVVFRYRCEDGEER